jgi:hypothetical protein
VQCTVYLLRRAGQKLPSDIIKNRPHVGWLIFGQDSRRHYPQISARLFKNSRLESDAIEPLIHAHVKKVDRGGILIYGQEEVPAYGKPAVPQIWWCIPGAFDDTTAP